MCFFLIFISGQNLASRKIQRPGWGVKDIGAQLWALKMIFEYILTVLILDFFLSLFLWNEVDCVTGACRASVMCSSLIGVLVTRDFQLPLLVG